jgi:hypothetical protein
VTTRLHPTLQRVTDRIIERSAATRTAYLASIAAQRKSGTQRAGMGCANMAHTTAALPASDKLKIHAERAPHVGIVTAYNDMLSAHQPYEHYPEAIRAARELGCHGTGRRRRARHVRRHHPGRSRHGAVAFLARRDRSVHRRGAVAQRVRRGAHAGRVRQDRARPVDGCPAVRPPAVPSSCPPGR